VVAEVFTHSTITGESPVQQGDLTIGTPNQIADPEIQMTPGPRRLLDDPQ
jgi:hypothetical protein